MKKYKFISQLFAFSFIALLCGSCNDFLTKDDPSGVTDADFWRTENDMNNAAGQCRTYPGGTMYYSSPYFCLMHLEGTSDNMLFNANFLGVIGQIGNGSVSPTSGSLISDLWQQWWIRIRRCNRFLTHANSAYFTDENERQRLICDIKVWRAWYYIQLLKYYGLHDGIPITTTPLTGNDIYQPRQTAQKCLDFINNELDSVIAIRNDNVMPMIWEEAKRDRMSRSIALTLKMDINLQMKNYEVAKAAAKEIIDANVYQLHKSTAAAAATVKGYSYYELFQYAGETNKERILFTTNGLNEYFFRCMPVLLGSQGTACVTKSLVDTYETADGRPIQDLPADEYLAVQKSPKSIARDPRLGFTVMMSGDTPLKDYTYKPFDESVKDYYTNNGAIRSGYGLTKFLCSADRSSRFGSLDYPIYRYAEVLLDYVECLVETGHWQDAEVYTYLNMIRERAGMPDVDKSYYNTEEKVRELYRRERRVELCFEGNKRYFDVIRWGIGSKVMTGTLYGAYNPNSGEFIKLEERNCSYPKNDSWPLPQSEVTANPNIQQPTGW